MRISRLDLIRYAHYDNRALAFDPAAALHLVYGPNEAGKSSALAAISDLLFGFARTKDARKVDFLYDAKHLAHRRQPGERGGRGDRLPPPSRQQGDAAGGQRCRDAPQRRCSGALDRRPHARDLHRLLRPQFGQFARRRRGDAEARRGARLHRHGGGVRPRRAHRAAHPAGGGGGRALRPPRLHARLQRGAEPPQRRERGRARGPS